MEPEESAKQRADELMSQYLEVNRHSRNRGLEVFVYMGLSAGNLYSGIDFPIETITDHITSYAMAGSLLVSAGGFGWAAAKQYNKMCLASMYRVNPSWVVHKLSEIKSHWLL